MRDEKYELTEAALVLNEYPSIKTLVTLGTSDTRQTCALTGVSITSHRRLKVALTPYNIYSKISAADSNPNSIVV